MPPSEHLIKILTVAFLYFGAGIVTHGYSASSHYELCWKVLEQQCENKGSLGCADLIKLCGTLLTEHLSVAHRPDDARNNCTHVPSPKARLLHRTKYTEGLSENPKNYTARSVLLAEKMVHLTEDVSVGPRISNLSENEQGRRFLGDLRGMLSPSKAPSFQIPLEKRTGHRPVVRPSSFRTRFTNSVNEYRKSLLATRTDLVVEWLVHNDRRFKEFLDFWKRKLFTS